MCKPTIIEPSYKCDIHYQVSSHELLFIRLWEPHIPSRQAGCSEYLEILPLKFYVSSYEHSFYFSVGQKQNNSAPTPTLHIDKQNKYILPWAKCVLATEKNNFSI